MAARRAPGEVAKIIDGSSKGHHDEVVRRLQRIDGQVSGIRRMYEGTASTCSTRSRRLEPAWPPRC